MAGMQSEPNPQPNGRVSPPPVQPPAENVSANAPAGMIGPAVNCCPTTVVISRWQTDTPTDYGFDDISNQPKRLTGNYWHPPTKKKTWPPQKEARDGSVWVSVPVGGEVELDVSFSGSVMCAENCKYEFVPPTIAAVVEPAPKSFRDALKITGLAEGEATLKVTCNGALIGYAHVWCRKMTTINLGVGLIKVTSARLIDKLMQMHPTTDLGLQTGLSRKEGGLAPPSVAELTTLLNEVYRPALMQFMLHDYGTIDFDTAPDAIKRRAQECVFDARVPIINNGGAVRMARQADEPTPLWQSSMKELGELTRQMVGGGQNKNIWFLPAPNVQLTNVAGAASEISGHDLFMFSVLQAADQSIPHEVGHILGLRHPADPQATSQYPEHILDGIAPGTNVVPGDVDNLMGYGRSQTHLLYRQWNALRPISNAQT